MMENKIKLMIKYTATKQDKFGFNAESKLVTINFESDYTAEQCESLDAKTKKELAFNALRSHRVIKNGWKLFDIDFVHFSL